MHKDTKEQTPFGSSDKAPTPPVPLWRVLEEEFHALYGDALQLDDTYERARDAAILRARNDLKAAIQERVDGSSDTLTDEELENEVTREFGAKPSLINAPACRELFQRVHRFVESNPGKRLRHTALCLSGGGIRSATFALGVLQGLASKGILQDFSYLSTVSGGGYIGAWLSSWIHRSGGDFAAVSQALAIPEKPTAKSARKATTSTAASTPKQPFDTEPEPIRHLRKYSNYLTPSLGFRSGDGWAVAAIVARNLLLNWILVVPLLLFILLLPRFAFCPEIRMVTESQQAGIVFAALAFVASVYALSNLIGRCGKTQGQVLSHCMLPIVLFCIFATLAWFCAARQGVLGRHYFFQSGLSPRWQSRAFFGAWGAMTAIVAMPFGMWIRKRCAPPPVPQSTVENPVSRRHPWRWCVIGLCLVVVFTLTGLAASGISEVVTKPIRDALAATPIHRVGGLAPMPKAKLYGICLALPLLLSLIFLANTLITGLLSKQMHDADREWLARVSGWAFQLAVLTGFVNFLVLDGPGWLVRLWDLSPTLFSSLTGGFALLTILGGKSAATAASAKGMKGIPFNASILQSAVKCVAPVFVIILFMLFSLATTLLLQGMRGEPLNPRDYLFLLYDCRLSSLALQAAIFLLIGFVSVFCVNINKFSLHAMYRNRLIRAYLGATNTKRAPNSFTGFDENDNLSLESLRGQRPFHVVNAALNLVGSTNLAWQQRLAMSFTFTPLFCGSAALGYRDSSNYARENHPRKSGITLGTALAISGAAVSPNHGYNSSRFVAFILTFFNARLGGWFGNPGLAGANTWQQSSPTRALQPIVAEALGLTDARHPYVYLSDGGHFENLGLYEMVLRRCHIIVVSDAECDPNYWFNSLGNAIAKIRVDFGIPITFHQKIDIRKLLPDLAEAHISHGHHCAVARICYSVVDGPGSDGKDRDGYLIYLKPAMCGNEPVDVFHYHRQHPDFPHEPTTEQWFTELQFESYRMLGTHTIQEICGHSPITDLDSFRKQAEIYAGCGHSRTETKPISPPSAQPAPQPTRSRHSKTKR